MKEIGYKGKLTIFSLNPRIRPWTKRQQHQQQKLRNDEAENQKQMSMGVKAMH